MNRPVVNLRDNEGKVMFNQDGSKQTVGNHISESPNRKQRRT